MKEIEHIVGYMIKNLPSFYHSAVCGTELSSCQISMNSKALSQTEIPSFPLNFPLPNSNSLPTPTFAFRPFDLLFLPFYLLKFWKLTYNSPAPIVLYMINKILLSISRINSPLPQLSLLQFQPPPPFSPTQSPP